MPTTITTFRNVRTRLYRVPNGVCLSGWITHLDRGEARVWLWKPAPLPLEERVFCECFGQGAVARFGAKIVGQAAEDVALEILGSIAYAPSDEPPRVRATGLVGSLATEGLRTSMRVLDLSDRGLGTLTPSEFCPGERLTLSLGTEHGPIRAEVAVANCRPEASEKGHFRVGLQILEMARLDQARWGRLMVERAEALA